MPYFMTNRTLRHHWLRVLAFAAITSSLLVPLDAEADPEIKVVPASGKAKSQLGSPPDEADLRALRVRLATEHASYGQNGPQIDRLEEPVALRVSGFAPVPGAVVPSDGYYWGVQVAYRYVANSYGTAHQAVSRNEMYLFGNGQWYAFTFECLRDPTPEERAAANESRAPRVRRPFCR